MKLEYRHYKLYFKYPFSLATGTREYTDTVIVKLTHEGYTGYGEASLPPYLKENVESVVDFLEKVDTKKLKYPLQIEEVLQYVDDIADGNNAAKAGIDIALNDIRGKILGKTIGELYNIPWHPVSSTYTIGITSGREGLKSKMQDANDFTYIKLKLGSKDDKAIVEEYLRLSDKPFCVDVNQGWDNKDIALEMTNWLAEKGVMFIEQPMPVKLIDQTAWLKEKASVPIIADEAVQRLPDIERIKDAYTGINIKLMKSAGIHEAVKMLNKAKELGLKVLIGCMAESSCSVTAAAHLSPLANWADLDGPHLIKNDPFEGLTVSDGKVVIPKRPGVGVVPLDRWDN